MTSHSAAVLAAGLVWLLSAVLVVPWLAAGESSSSSSVADDCQRSCGRVDIPFPFGMGPDHCMLTRDFRITCEDVGNGVRKAPFLANFTNVEVLNISLEQGQAQVLNPISSYCYNATVQQWDEWTWDLSSTSYTFSNTANKFTVVGCRALAYIGNTKGNTSAMYQTGCVSMCFQGSMDLNACSGMGCCQTGIPKGLKYYHVWFDKRLNTSGIDDGTGGSVDPCSFAVLMDSSNNISSPEFNDSNNSPSEFNSSRGGKAPVVLDWSIGHDDCKTAVRNNNPAGYACRSINSSCSDATSGRGYIYINECKHPDKYNCSGACTNTIGSYNCRPKEAFPRGALIAAGILLVFVVALIAFLSIEVFRNKEKKKRQGFFQQHGGQMLLQIIEKDANNIAFKLYERKDLVKATRRFHKDNVVGEGTHGTVYKAILGTATTVAVKRCKQIDKSRTDEFVQELVVACRVSHPNIVRLLGCCLHFEAPMLVYEFVPNGTLRDLLHGSPRRRVVTLPTRLRIAAETAEALAHLHSPPRPTLHGDVKPDNILLGDGWVAKVSDFGCSTINDNVQVVPKGTLAYLDPEFLQDRQITEKTDVYSFGIVLIELLTGKNPLAEEWKKLTVMFQNSMRNGTLGDLLDADIVEEWSMGLIYEVAKLVSRCIAAPGKTRPDMRQVAKELRGFSDEMPESSEARVALGFEDRSRYSYTATEGETTGFSNLSALSTELAR
ncbi:wall-associated receptor kinase 2 isoform X3 [Sorghum bicolor]|uniref:wall-associated receptor kinase 2 isoform X3 n=1 Tax=Sorghum bicolor TaxID=4558 RepID=UPI000B426673|nr:wall-associated receptor kinase 2 isoform X3 [Sorghum bicolor]|eukprot:XP_021316631.1 wall-associated receptor kinase 2 isoform X3 [Sorghum bicolor]